MTLKAAIWVHGTIVEAEDPTSVKRMGWGAQFAGRNLQNQLDWFHIPLTTPVILDGVRPELGKIIVFYKTANCIVRSVNIFDGPTKVWAADDLNLAGDHSAELDESNTWIIDPPILIKFGLGISVGVSFGFQSSPPGNILFTSAGADFLTP